MSDLISRKALIAEYDRVHVGAPGGARKLMEEAPGVYAVEVVLGHWRKYSDDKCMGYGADGRILYRKVYTYECSKCGRNVAVKSNYCPNCGADMRERGAE